MKRKARIIERIDNNKKTYVIQQRHRFFWWIWIDGSVNSDVAYYKDSFDTLEDAKRNFYHFDGTKTKERIVHKN